MEELIIGKQLPLPSYALLVKGFIYVWPFKLLIQCQMLCSSRAVATVQQAMLQLHHLLPLVLSVYAHLTRYKMGSGGWIKTIIRRKKVRQGKSEQTTVSSASAGKANGSQSENQSQQNACDGAACGINRVLCMPKEHIAAVHIQTAFRAFLARKALSRMKGAVRLQNLPQHQSVKKQSISTLNHLQSWTTMQAEIQIRRRSMVLEAQTKQKKLENQSKLEAKLQDLDVDWCGGSETMEEILARINQREEAAVKRERALAYAFSHQWRANCVQREGTKTSLLSKANQGWSWKERWVAARPWEIQLQSQSVSPKKEKNTSASKASKNDSSSVTQRLVTVKSSAPNGKGPTCRA